jgi:transcriptional regulator of heat shock response
MTAFHFQTQVSESGVITLPPEYRNRKVEVSVDVLRNRLQDKPTIKKKRKATEEEVQKFMDTCYGCLEELTDTEFEQMKMEKMKGKQFNHHHE